MAETVPILRQWLLLKMLSARRLGVTLREMADDTGCSQKTIRRDLVLLKRVGFPVDETTADHGRKHWRIAESHGGPAMTFNWTEAIALYLGWRLLQPLAGTQFGEAGESAYAKIRAALGDQALHYVDKMASAFHLTAVGTSNYAAKSQVLDDLTRAIEDHVVTWLIYQSERSTEPVTREIHPYGWIQHKHSLYLVAWATEHQAIRTYKADRIESADVTELRFPRPVDFDLAEYVSSSFGIYRGNRHEPIRALIRFHPAVAQYVSEKQWHESQELTRQPDGSLLVEFTLVSTEELRAWVLSFGENAVVLQPEELRQEIAQTLQKALAAYGADPNQNATVTNPRLARPALKGQTRLPRAGKREPK